MIEVQDRVPELSRLSEDSEYIHVSSLLDLCPRQYWIARKHRVTLRSSPFSADRIVWEIGKSLERHVVKQLRAYHGAELVQTNNSLIDDDEYFIVGAPDVEITVDQNTVVIAEVKTMNKTDFDKLKSPIADHILQVALYQWLFNKVIGSQGFRRAHDTVIILYVCKDYARNSPYKEFHVNVNTPVVQSGVETALELAAELKDARDKDEIPERWVCDRQDCARSKKCAVSHLCWSL
jgi:hypothetical protein